MAYLINFRKEETMNIYVGNLALNVTEDDLKEIFDPFGEVDSVKIIKDRYSGESRGFGFVEMPSGGDGQAAIQSINGKELKGLKIKVNEARPQKIADPPIDDGARIEDLRRHCHACPATKPTRLLSRQPQQR